MVNKKALPEFVTPVAAMGNVARAIKKLENLKPTFKVDLVNDISYFNNPKEIYDETAYDLFFAYTKPYPLYDKRKQRENKRYPPDIRENIFRQPTFEVDLVNDISYFNNPKEMHDETAYDLFFAYTKPYPLYDQRKQRENKKYPLDIRENIFRQEEHKAVPATTSMNYGKRIPYDIDNGFYHRRNQIVGFYRQRRVIWGPEESKCIEDVDKDL